MNLPMALVLYGLLTHRFTPWDIVDLLAGLTPLDCLAIAALWVVIEVLDKFAVDPLVTKIDKAWPRWARLKGGR